MIIFQWIYIGLLSLCFVCYGIGITIDPSGRCEGVNKGVKIFGSIAGYIAILNVFMFAPTVISWGIHPLAGIICFVGSVLTFIAMPTGY